MKETICTVAGVVGSFIAGLFGGWDASMVTLLLFMGVDYITGIAVAACGKSPKSDRRLSSKIGWRGLAKKCVSLLLVLVAQRFMFRTAQSMMMETSSSHCQMVPR